MVSTRWAPALLTLLMMSGSLAGETHYLGRAEGDFTISSFRFGTGEVLDQLKLHYLTVGRPHRNSTGGGIDNAVLLLHSTGSDTTEFLESAFTEPV